MSIPLNETPLSKLLRLLQFADSAFPIGSLSHSFGLESMVAEEQLDVSHLWEYFNGLLEEGLLLEAVYCRSAHELGAASSVEELSTERLRELNTRLSALRLARECREASVALGRRFIRLAASFEPNARLLKAAGENEMHYPVAFGFACGVLMFEAGASVGAFLHTTMLNLISAVQRLLPLGQREATLLAWDLKPAILKAVEKSELASVETVVAFSPLPEMASMRHPSLSTRLFVS